MYIRKIRRWSHLAAADAVVVSAEGIAGNDEPVRLDDASASGRLLYVEREIEARLLAYLDDPDDESVVLVVGDAGLARRPSSGGFRSSCRPNAGW